MMGIKRVVSAGILILTATSMAVRIQGSEQGTGSISGVVVNEAGKPVVKAEVNADLIDGRPRAKAITYVETDEGGHFKIEGLAWGSYRIFVRKEQENYPNSLFSFYNPDPAPRVSLTAELASAEISLKMGAKAAVLRILSVTD